MSGNSNTADETKRTFLKNGLTAAGVIGLSAASGVGMAATGTDGEKPVKERMRYSAPASDKQVPCNDCVHANGDNCQKWNVSIASNGGCNEGNFKGARGYVAHEMGYMTSMGRPRALAELSCTSCKLADARSGGCEHAQFMGRDLGVGEIYLIADSDHGCVEGFLPSSQDARPAYNALVEYVDSSLDDAKTCSSCVHKHADHTCNRMSGHAIKRRHGMNRQVRDDSYCVLHNKA